jgi:hypothetical protein
MTSLSFYFSISMNASFEGLPTTNPIRALDLAVFFEVVQDSSWEPFVWRISIISPLHAQWNPVKD